MIINFYHISKSVQMVVRNNDNLVREFFFFFRCGQLLTRQKCNIHLLTLPKIYFSLLNMKFFRLVTFPKNIFFHLTLKLVILILLLYLKIILFLKVWSWSFYFSNFANSVNQSFPSLPLRVLP